MTTTKTFGFYIHYRANGLPFYVGKGTERRAHKFGKGQRSRYHKFVVEKDGRDNIKVLFVPCSSEQEAFDKEIALIALYRNMGVELVNFTSGGEGMAGVIPWNKGKKHTAESLIKMSTAHKKQWQDPEFREHALKKRWTPELKAKQKLPPSAQAAATEAKRRPDHRAKVSSMLKGKKLSAETRAKLCVIRKAKWADPDYRAKMLKANEGKHAKSQETRDKLSAVRKAQWADPIYRDKMLAALRRDRARDNP